MEERLTVCDKAAEIPTDYAVPCCTLSFVELEEILVLVIRGIDMHLQSS